MVRIPSFRERTPGALTSTRAIYLCFYMALGAFLPFINLYYEHIGLSGLQIGALAAIPLLVGSITALCLGAISDAFHLHSRILNLALLLVPLPVLMISQTSRYSSLVPYVFAYAIISSPIIPLLDSKALEVVRIHQRSFGGLRVWGSIGWAISTLLVGALIEKYNIRMLFYCYAVFIFITFFLSFFQPSRLDQLKTSFSHGLQLLTRLNVLVFLFSIFLLSVTIGAFNAFFSIYLYEIGAGEGMIGLGWALAAASEVPVMVLSGVIMRRIRASGLLRVAFLTYAVRWLLLSFIDEPILALFVQLLHGLSFAAFIVGGITYINSRVPQGLSATAQAVFNAVTFGIGSITGALVGGYLYDMAGMVSLFRVLSIIAIVGLVIFWLGARPRSNVGVGLTYGES